MGAHHKGTDKKKERTVRTGDSRGLGGEEWVGRACRGPLGTLSLPRGFPGHPVSWVYKAHSVMWDSQTMT